MRVGGNCSHAPYKGSIIRKKRKTKGKASENGAI